MAVFTKTMRKHIFLHPKDKDKASTAVKSALLQDKNKYSDKLEGSLLDVSNLKVINDRYLIVNGYLSMEVIADFVVFSPHVGQTLEGVINKKSKSHLGCLVLDTFNASLDVPSSFEVEPQVGNSCTFVVTEVVIDGEILFLRGTLASLASDEDTTDIFEDVIEEETKTHENSRLEIKNEPYTETSDNDPVRATNELPGEKTGHTKSKKKSKKSPKKKLTSIKQSSPKSELV